MRRPAAVARGFEAVHDVGEELRDLQRRRANRKPCPGPSGRSRAGPPRAERAGPSPPRRSEARPASSSGRARLPKRELELGLEERQRRSQLVARVGDEPALARERRLEPREHLVQRLAEPPDLVVGLRERQPPALARRRDARPPRAASTRPAAAPQPPARSRRARRAAERSARRSRSCVRRLASASSRALEGGADDHDQASALRVNGRRQHAGRIVPVGTAGRDPGRSCPAARASSCPGSSTGASSQPGRRIDDGAVVVDHLCEALVGRSQRAPAAVAEARPCLAGRVR